MSINGASRILQAEAQLNKESQTEINSAFKNEDKRVKGIKKFSLKASKSEHNHSK